MDQNCKPAVWHIIPSIILGIALIIAGCYISKGLIKFRSYERFVSVKGLATRDVEADLAIWTIKHSATGNTLSEVQGTIRGNSAKITAFLQKQGLKPADIVNRKLEVTDLLAQAYRPDNAGDNRFIVSEIITVRTNNVDIVDKALQAQGDLLSQDVSLVSDQGQQPVEYVYTHLNDLKPEMIAEATKNARESAEQFAKDSGARVGSIQSASQGVFQINPRDSDNSYNERQFRYKNVRVVSTLQFYLD